MAIQYQENERIFTLHTDHSTYQMRTDSYGDLLYLYYGDKTEGSMGYILISGGRGFSPSPHETGDDRTYSLDASPREYLHQGSGDSRGPAFVVEQADRSYGLNLHYTGYEICKGKHSLPGLSAMYEEGREDVESPKIYLTGQVSRLAVTLLYDVFPGYDIVTRAVCVENGGDDPTALKQVYSVCLDFLHEEYDLIQFYGRHAMERNFQRTALCHDTQAIDSRGEISNRQYNPFLILVGRETTEASEPCCSMFLMYSSPFKAEVGTDQHGQTRMAMGLQNKMFSYELKPEERLFEPEVTMGCSGQGPEVLSCSIHKIMHHSLCREKHKIIPRPVLINSQEATYLDFTREKILDTARQVKDLDVEMMVLDDGWFGSRDSGLPGLGGWQVNVKKLGGSLDGLVGRINGLGMKFGI